MVGIKDTALGQTVMGGKEGSHFVALLQILQGRCHDVLQFLSFLVTHRIGRFDHDRSTPFFPVTLALALSSSDLVVVAYVVFVVIVLRVVGWYAKKDTATAAVAAVIVGSCSLLVPMPPVVVFREENDDSLSSIALPTARF
jgi:hypothetical protein